MAIKRYSPKYKIISKLRQPLNFDKRSKVRKFTRQKWEGKERIYFPRKAKYFDQDSSTYVVNHTFDGDRSFSLRKVYKYLLLDKQGLLHYYGERRLKTYQLKSITALVKYWSQKKRLSGGKVFLHFLENRLEIGLKRLGLVTSLMQARKLLTSSHVAVNHHLVKNFGLQLKNSDLIRVENWKMVELLARYLKFNLPFFYFRKKEVRSLALVERRRVANKNFIQREELSSLSLLKQTLSTAISTRT